MYNGAHISNLDGNMAGITFSFDNFEALLELNIGIAQRLDENRAESFTLLYCDFEGLTADNIDESLTSTLRQSDSVVYYDKNYFFVLPYTDKYGAEVVKQIFEDLFEKPIPHFMVSYPVDGESGKELLEMMQNSLCTFLKSDIEYLDQFTK